MILVLSTQAGDYSHVNIIDWLNHLGSDFLILTGEAILLGEQNLTIQNGSIFCDETNLTKEVTAVFYRRWLTSASLKIDNDPILSSDLNKNIVSEMYEIRNFLYDNLKHVIWIPAPTATKVNKLSNLKLAETFSFNVPDYIVTNSKKDLLIFFQENQEQIITKAIGNFQQCYSHSTLLVNPIYTKQVSKKDIGKLPNNFVPSFFQKLIQKEHEYRILYFNKKCYPSIILSQEKKMTTLDSRIHDERETARLVPAKIPRTLEQKIIFFMEALNLNIGCLDFLYSKSGEYFFLEVNPVGQFGGYSYRCMLNFEKDIVIYLNDLDHDKKTTKANKIESV